MQVYFVTFRVFFTKPFRKIQQNSTIHPCGEGESRPSKKRKTPPKRTAFSCARLFEQKSVVSVLEALAAVDGAIVVRLEGNLALLATVGAGSVEHLAGRSLTALSLTGVAAITASLGLVGEALLGVELLLAGGENEFASAILADNGLVSVHVIPRFI